ncbi:HPr-rel-A system PqqD family peptide chaperone [Pseudothauera nasutitermitis]|uniref:HPr-rel-A system PqqD family peptide chaperone n=1 Tax=Pseudothauera nasutitermitis TaxID=2565930 RepID=UPI001454BD08|nr:HPr-rel-A system PqqD family peptide chaperone [Pseudothauera nasutitermitis]
MTLLPTQTPRFREAVWDDGAALYDRRSGDTHLLDRFVLAVLHAAQAAGTDLPGITARLAAEGADTSDPARIESALDQLLAARLL